MRDGQQLSPGVAQFVESMGVYFEQYNLPRIGGRILGLLLVADRPLSLDDMAGLLHVSRASVSTNVRLVTATGLAELVTFPGDRRDYYRFALNAWERALTVDMEGAETLRRMAERGLAVARADERVARAHLEQLLEFCEFLVEDRRTLLERWRAHRAARQRA